MFWLEIGLTIGVVLLLLTRYFKAKKIGIFPWYGWLGLAVIVTSGVLLLLNVRIVGLLFTPLVWTGYILVVDATVFSLQNRSILRSSPEAFLWMVILSIFLRLILEIYNQALLNWTYVGFPRGTVGRYLGYGWLFATAWPVVLETTDLLMALRRTKLETNPISSRPFRNTVLWTGVGLFALGSPLLAPWPVKVYLFGLVWLGCILVSETLNYSAARLSILGDLFSGYRARMWALLEAGMLCGYLGEFWNYWAHAKWLYIFPILENFTFFEMPIVGYLGFPVSAVAVFSLYVLLTALLNLPNYEVGQNVVDREYVYDSASV